MSENTPAPALPRRFFSSNLFHHISEAYKRMGFTTKLYSQATTFGDNPHFLLSDISPDPSSSSIIRHPQCIISPTQGLNISMLAARRIH
jgi:hypothetical protein